MRELWLHIGSHKTGTSSLQYALRDAYTNGHLGDLHYSYCPNKISVNELIRVSGVGKRQRVRIDYRGLKAAMSEPGSYVISSEMFFWIRHPRQVRKLARVLKRRFDKIHVVAYLRRQDSLAISHLKQVLLRDVAQNFYGLSVSALPPYQTHFDHYFHYDQKLKMWGDAFRTENLIIRKFEKSALFNHDTVDDFFNLLGLAKPEQRDHINTPFSRKQLLVGLHQLAQGVARPKVVKLIKRINDTDKLTPSRAQAEAFLNHFQDSNRRLAEMLGDNDAPLYFDMDLSRYPEVGNDNVSDEEIEQWIAAHTDPKPR